MKNLRHGRGLCGFTLIELMIAVVVIGILASVAYPSFLAQVRKGRRADAVDVAAKVLQAQERYRGNQTEYTNDVSALSGYGVPNKSPAGYYTFTLSGASTNGYTLNLTGVSGQEKDEGCSTMKMVVSAGSPTYTDATCWSR